MGVGSRDAPSQSQFLSFYAFPGANIRPNIRFLSPTQGCLVREIVDPPLQLILYVNNYAHLTKAPTNSNGTLPTFYHTRHSGGSRIFPRWGGQPSGGGGGQHTILPNFPQNCMKLKEFVPGGARPSRPLDLPMRHLIASRLFLRTHLEAGSEVWGGGRGRSASPLGIGEPNLCKISEKRHEIQKNSPENIRR